MKQRRNHLLEVILAIPIFLVGWYLLSGILDGNISVRHESTPVPTTYAITEMTSNFELLWTKQPFTIASPKDRDSILLTSKFDEAYVLSSNIGSIIAIDLESGEEEFLIHERYKAGSFPHASTMGINSSSFFIGFQSTQKIGGNMTWGAGKVKAYDRASGALLWSQVIPGASSISLLSVTEDTVSIGRGSGSNYYLLDAETGVIIKSDPSTLVWKVQDNLVYQGSCIKGGYAFQLYNQEYSEIIWQSELICSRPSIFTDSRIITKGGTQVIALDISNGQNIWEHSQAYSNIAVSNGVVYFVTDKGNLFAVDIMSGDVLGNVQFTTPPDNNRYNTFQVTSSNDIVLIHTGYVGNQLFAFHFR